MQLKIVIDTKTDAATTHLLRELDRWLDLGLLSPDQLHGISQKLSSPLPLVYAPTVPEDMAVVASTPDRLNQRDWPSSPVARKPALSLDRFQSRLVQSFLAEVSVLWLLFLGVFLVVVSSGVLAASQWQSFSAVGQYAILLVYTLAFGVASRWAAAQENLQTTAQMLTAATLLLIPLNFWMMDALGLVTSALGLGLGFCAAVGLSWLAVALASQRLTGLNILGLSWLHWGWNFGYWPLIAAYLGVVGSTAHLARSVPARPVFLKGVSTQDSDPLGDGREGDGSVGLLVTMALLILLVRSLWIAQIPFYQLGLACGICGWLLYRLGKYPFWSQLGTGLMLLGWLMSVGQQPLQSLGVSALAIGLLLDRLGQQAQEREQLRTLTILWLMGGQACGLMWFILPLAFRQGLLIWVNHLESATALNLAGVWLYGYVGVMVLGAMRFRRHDQVAWAQWTEHLALGLGGLLVLCTRPQSMLFTISVFGVTLTLAAITRGRQATWLIYGTHLGAIATVLSGLDVISQQLGGWSDLSWAMVFLALTLVEWLASVAVDRYPLWRRSAWHLGMGLGAITYGLLLDHWTLNPGWIALVWLLVPGLLTGLVYRRHATAQPQLATTLTVMTLGGQVLLLNSWSMATVAFGLGSGLLVLHSRRWPTKKWLPVLAVGAAVMAVHMASMWLWLARQDWPHGWAQLLLLMGLLVVALKFSSDRLCRYQGLRQSYGLACRSWSLGVAAVLTLGLTLLAVVVYGWGAGGWGYRTVGLDALTPTLLILLRYGAATMTLLVAIVLVARRQRSTYLGDGWLGYGVGLLVALGLPLWQQEARPEMLGAALVFLGLGGQLLGTVYRSREGVNPQDVYRPSWHYVPLAYGGLGLVLGHVSFTAQTGLYALVTGVVALGVGRRRLGLSPWAYGGLGLLSLGAYEVLIYRMLQASGGEPGDGLSLLALLGVAIAYLLLLPTIRHYSRLPSTGIATVSLIHWLLSLILVFLATVVGQSQRGVWLWLGVAGVLTLYAWLQGNEHWQLLATAQTNDSADLHRLTPNNAQWTWIGLIMVTFALPYALDQLFPNLTFRGWGALVVCGLGLGVYSLPWQHWGWPRRPWQQMALAWPILAILLTLATIKTQSLLLVGVFYAVMAKQTRAMRMSYLSLGLLNWSLLRYLTDQGWLTPLGLGLLLGLSTLYIVHVDPHWQIDSARQQRHRLRSFATLLMGITALYQAEISAPIFAALTLLLSLGAIGLGLVIQIRAYLYMGTLTFGLQVLRILMLFVGTDGRLLWAIGIVLGITLIWIAATFEARRAQVSGLVTHWAQTLDCWE